MTDRKIVFEERRLRNPSGVDPSTVPAGWRLEWEDEPYRVRQRRIDVGLPSTGVMWSLTIVYGRWRQRDGSIGRCPNTTYVVSIREDD